MSTPFKFGYLNPDGQAYQYPNVWARAKTSGPDRLVIAPAFGQIDMLIRLIDVIPEPFWLLYLLVIPRGVGAAGRYQAQKPLSREEVKSFLREFKDFLELDGRHHLWIASDQDPAMLIYDRHNKIFAYGSLDRFEAIAADLGLSETQSITWPDPHLHHYHAKFDEDEKRLLNLREWICTPLQASDVK